MARVVKPPINMPLYGKTPLKHGAKVEIVSLCSSKVMLMDPNGAMRANMGGTNSGSKFVVSELGAAVMLQCALTGHIIGANAGYLYGFRANEQQAALRVYYHEDSGAVEFESCADPGKFLAFDRNGNIIPLGGNSVGLPRQFAVRKVEDKAKQEASKTSLTGLMNMGMKAVSKAVGEGETQYNFEKHNLRSVMLNFARIRLKSKVTGRYLAIMSNGIVHGNGDQSDVLVVHHCFGPLRYAFQSEKYPRLWLCVTLDNITWAMHNSMNSTAKKENPAMVWEVDKCRSDGTVLLRRNTALSNGTLHQYLGFAPTGKPTPTLIFPEEMGDMIIEKTTAPLHAQNNAPVVLHAHSNAPVPVQSPAPPAPPAAMNYGSAPPPPAYSASAPGSAPPSAPGSATSPEVSLPGYSMPPGALLYEGSVLLMKNKLGYLSVSGGKLETAGSVNKDAEWRVTSSGFMVFSFENVKNGGFLKIDKSAVALGPPGNDACFSVRFNPNGSVSFAATANESIFIGIKDPEMFLEMV